MNIKESLEQPNQMTFQKKRAIGKAKFAVIRNGR